jgi:hypothetical protein
MQSPLSQYNIANLDIQITEVTNAGTPLSSTPPFKWRVHGPSSSPPPPLAPSTSITLLPQQSRSFRVSFNQILPDSITDVNLINQLEKCISQILQPAADKGKCYLNEEILWLMDLK